MSSEQITTTKIRFDVAMVMKEIKKMFINHFKNKNIRQLMLDEEYFKTNDPIYIIPADGSGTCFPLIGFEIKEVPNHSTTDEIILMYIGNNKIKRLHIYECMNQESIEYALTRIIDFYKD